jgi:hypothetical protein
MPDACAIGRFQLTVCPRTIVQGPQDWALFVENAY